MDPSVVLQGHGTLGEDDAIWKRNTDFAIWYWYLAAANWIAASVNDSPQSQFSTRPQSIESPSD
jgi:hypothetical protein